MASTSDLDQDEDQVQGPQMMPPRNSSGKARWVQVLPRSHPLHGKIVFEGPIKIGCNTTGTPEWTEPPNPAKQAYLKALDETEGFDMPHLTGICNGIHPVVPWNEETIRKLYCFSAEAIQHYNHKHGTFYRVLHVEKAMQQLVSGLNYFITFKAKIDETITTTTPPALPTVQTFEAWVYVRLNQVKVMLCRLQGDKRVPVLL